MPFSNKKVTLLSTQRQGSYEGYEGYNTGLEKDFVKEPNKNL
jgi:hypothetical protein